jgi:hypothetical protein
VQSPPTGTHIAPSAVEASRRDAASEPCVDAASELGVEESATDAAGAHPPLAHASATIPRRITKRFIPRNKLLRVDISDLQPTFSAPPSAPRDTLAARVDRGSLPEWGR